MKDPKALTRTDILRAAATLRFHRKMPRWLVIVEGRELPARPLVLEAAGAQPNNPTNSHQAVAILERLGFETRYAAASDRAAELPQEIPSGAAGSLSEALGEITNSVPADEWRRMPDDLSKNIDRYLYSNKR